MVSMSEGICAGHVAYEGAVRAWDAKFEKRISVGGQ